MKSKFGIFGFDFWRQNNSLLGQIKGTWICRKRRNLSVLLSSPRFLHCPEKLVWVNRNRNPFCLPRPPVSWRASRFRAPWSASAYANSIRFRTCFRPRRAAPSKIPFPACRDSSGPWRSNRWKTDCVEYYSATWTKTFYYFSPDSTLRKHISQ